MTRSISSEHPHVRRANKEPWRSSGAGLDSQARLSFSLGPKRIAATSETAPETTKGDERPPGETLLKLESFAQPPERTLEPHSGLLHGSSFDESLRRQGELLNDA